MVKDNSVYIAHMLDCIARIDAVRCMNKLPEALIELVRIQGKGTLATQPCWQNNQRL